MLRTFAIPTVLAVVSTVGIIGALVWDGLAFVVALAGVGLPLVAIVRAWRKT